MRRRIVAVIRVVAAACLPLVLHTAAGSAANGHPAPGAWDLPGASTWAVANQPGASIRAVADQPQAVPGAGQGFLTDRHIAAGLTCTACHTTTPNQPVSTGTCLSCHGGTYDKLAAMTAADDPNPHQSHQGAVPCVTCHHVHLASENFCSQCHAEFDFRVP